MHTEHHERERVARQMKTSYIFLLLNSMLIIPLIGNMSSNEFHWGPEDYVIACCMLNVLGLALYASNRYVTNIYFRYGFFVIAFTIFLLIWAELAVGIF